MEKVITIKVAVSGLENLAEALLKLVTSQQKTPVQSVQAAVPTTSVSPAVQAAVPTTSVPPAVLATSVPPGQAATTALGLSVATSQVSYTLDDLARAAMTLMDSGKQAQLQELLAQFGVNTLPALPPEHYGAFATSLRGMGGQI